MSDPATVMTLALQQIRQGLARLEDHAATVGSPRHRRWLATLLQELRALVGQLQALQRGPPVREDAMQSLQERMARLAAALGSSSLRVAPASPLPAGARQANAPGVPV